MRENDSPFSNNSVKLFGTIGFLLFVRCRFIHFVLTILKLVEIYVRKGHTEKMFLFDRY